MKAQCQGKYNKEIVKIFSNLVADPMLKHHHWEADQKTTRNDDETCNPREMLIQKIQISVNGPSANMKNSMNQRTVQDGPSTIDVKLM
jgi:hypothetical protein